MHTGQLIRPWLVILAGLVGVPLRAQGTENAIAAAVVFGAVVFASVLAGLVITVLYLFKRRSWQRVVVLVFGAVLLLTGMWLAGQPGGNNDIEFLQLLLSGAGLLLVLLGSFLRPRRAARSVRGE